MAILAWLLGIIGGLCGVMGILTAVEVAPTIIEDSAWSTWVFWLALAVVLLVGSVAAAVGRGGTE